MDKIRIVNRCRRICSEVDYFITFVSKFCAKNFFVLIACMIAANGDDWFRVHGKICFGKITFLEEGGIKKFAFSKQKNLSMKILPMKPEHWNAVKKIYEEGIATGNATFETESPSWEQWNSGHLPFARI